MDNQILQLFKENFEVFFQEHNDIKNKIKKETLKHVEELIKEDQYNESQYVIEALENFLKQLEINLDYSSIENKFNSFQNLLKEPSYVQTNKEKKATPITKKEQPYVSQVEQISSTINANEDFEFLMQESKSILSNLEFEILKEENEELKVIRKESKKRMNYYFTVNKTSFQKEDYYQKLNEKAMDLKNIGFICYDETNLQNVKNISEEWVENNPDKRAFLSIHFTTIERLRSNPNNPFVTLSYE